MYRQQYKKMKKIVLAIFALVSIWNLAKAQDGQLNICPGTMGGYVANFTNHGYTTSTNWSISNNGHFDAINNMGGGTISTDGKHLTFGAAPGPGSYNYNNPVYIDWDGIVTTASIFAEQTYIDLLGEHTETIIFYVNIGPKGVPANISTPSSICTSGPNPTNHYSASCLDNLTAVNASSCYWTISNGTIIGADINGGYKGTSVLFDKIISSNPSSSGPINLTVVYTSTCSGLGLQYNSTKTVTISRCSQAPLPGGVNYRVSPVGVSQSFYFSPSTYGTSVEMSTDGITWSAPAPTQVLYYVPAGTSQGVYIRSVNDCGTGASAYYNCKAAACPSCPKRLMNVTSFESGILEVNVYPNPANDQLTVSIPETDQVVNVSIYNLTGQLVKEIQVSGNTNTIVDVAALPSGMYITRIVSADGKLNQVNKIQIIK